MPLVCGQTFMASRRHAEAMFRQVSDAQERKLVDITNFPTSDGPDYEAQCDAIRRLLYRQEQADQELEAEKDEAGEVAARTTGMASDRAVDRWVELLETSIYQDVAHSIAAAGLAVAFVESVLRRALIGSKYEHSKLSYIMGNLDEGLKKYLPPGFELTVSALVAYRNQTGHNGFEWSPGKYSNFEKEWQKHNWPSDWFLKVTVGGDPWVCYMSPVFVKHCIQTMEQTAKGAEKRRLGVAPDFDFTLPPGAV